MLTILHFTRLYVYQPETGGVIDEDYEGKIISDIVGKTI